MSEEKLVKYDILPTPVNLQDYPKPIQACPELIVSALSVFSGQEFKLWACLCDELESFSPYRLREMLDATGMKEGKNSADYYYSKDKSSG